MYSDVVVFMGSGIGIDKMNAKVNLIDSHFNNKYEYKCFHKTVIYKTIRPGTDDYEDRLGMLYRYAKNRLESYDISILGIWSLDEVRFSPEILEKLFNLCKRYRVPLWVMSGEEHIYYDNYRCEFTSTREGKQWMKSYNKKYYASKENSDKLVDRKNADTFIGWEYKHTMLLYKFGFVVESEQKGFYTMRSYSGDYSVISDIFDMVIDRAISDFHKKFNVEFKSIYEYFRNIDIKKSNGLIIIEIYFTNGYRAYASYKVRPFYQGRTIMGEYRASWQDEFSYIFVRNIGGHNRLFEFDTFNFNRKDCQSRVLDSDKAEFMKELESMYTSKKEI